MESINHLYLSKLGLKVTIQSTLHCTEYFVDSASCPEGAIWNQPVYIPLVHPLLHIFNNSHNLMQKQNYMIYALFTLNNYNFFQEHITHKKSR